MTTLERPMPLPLVVVLLSAISVVGFVLGLRGALDTGKPADAVSTAPLAEVSGVPVKDATPAPVEVAPPPPPPAPKPVETAPEEVAPETPPVVQAPIAPATPPPAEKKPEVPPAQQTPQRIEDLY